ncbi:lysophospholipid acyltransferase family protein [Desulfotalea psychrophila]|uniref:Phospholipid/glycerol acyltransferase domain-containing protein n=1 Tax=Desulfotalea psychrophila (strain LSv54 / DSM 12343) TaxID=177439 RepID=Q6AL51_DESPS|nr:lysophospholipid acyltransferase family protein [Desulfotalea psychrophila]CAG36924.1 conserved hypothetical protein [Desulfotalea psychrophila LSv54]
MIQKISHYILRLNGWKIIHTPMPKNKYLIIGAPHTSNWDFPLALLCLSALHLRFWWAAKHSLFHFPLGWFFRKMGGIAVNRRVRNDFLRTIKKEYNKREEFILAIAPEGTRSFTNHWKCGFYQIAIEAEVDIALAFLDYSTKTMGIGKIIQPSGNIEEDFEKIAAFYHDIKGKYPEKQSTIAIRANELKHFKRMQEGQKN